MLCAKKVKAEERVVKTDLLDYFKEGGRSHSQVHLTTEVHNCTSEVECQIKNVEKFSCVYPSKSTIRRNHWAGRVRIVCTKMQLEGMNASPWYCRVPDWNKESLQKCRRPSSSFRLGWLFWPLASPFCYHSDCLWVFESFRQQGSVHAWPEGSTVPALLLTSGCLISSLVWGRFLSISP